MVGDGRVECVCEDGVVGTEEVCEVGEEKREVWGNCSQRFIPNVRMPLLLYKVETLLSHVLINLSFLY